MKIEMISFGFLLLLLLFGNFNERIFDHIDTCDLANKLILILLKLLGSSRMTSNTFRDPIGLKGNFIFGKLLFNNLNLRSLFLFDFALGVS